MIRAIFSVANNLAKSDLFYSDEPDILPPPLSREDNRDISKLWFFANSSMKLKRWHELRPSKPCRQTPPVPSNLNDNKLCMNLKIPRPPWNQVKLLEGWMMWIKEKQHKSTYNSI